MNGKAGGWQPRRVVMSLLADADGRAALAQAAQLARSLGSELACVFVEESDLMALAALPNSAEIGRVSGRLRPIDSRTLNAELARNLAAVRRDFSALAGTLVGAGEREVEVLRGHALDPFRRALPDDLLFYAGSLRRLAGRDLMETLQEAALRTAGILLPQAQPTAAAGPVVAVVGSAAGAERILPVLQRLAGGPGSAIEIFLAGAPARLPPGLAAGAPGVRLRGVEGSAALHSVAAIAARSGARLLVSETGAALLSQGAELRAVLRQLRCPLLLMNQEGG
ncbi:MAG: hypothetical protein WD341_18660 [Tistlia sp.]|uniref:hypothetical protein n=1 Tax=Tistlia sp. TaxID=3057121 RepID=UPI0034A11D3A